MAVDHATGGAEGTRLEHMPVAFFASVMGFSGLTLAWTKAAHVFGLALPVPLVLAGVSAAIFIVLVVAYGLKIAIYPSAVAEEYRHPVKINFLPAISISIVLLSIIALEHAKPLAEPLFLVGTALHLVFTLLILNNWFNKTHYDTVHLNPAWFIPIVGNVLVPLTGVALGYVELSWFFFAIGIVFWLVLFAIIVNRVLFHHPLPERLAPTLFILIAPPAVGFLSYVKLTGGIDPFARVLYYFALFLTLFLVLQIPRLMKAKFFLSWWAYSFPLAAITVASLLMVEKLNHPFMSTLGVLLLGLVSVVVAGLTVRTLIAIGRHEICQPE